MKRSSPCSCHSYLVKGGKFLGGETPALAEGESRQLELGWFFDKQMDIQRGPKKTLLLQASCESSKPRHCADTKKASLHRRSELPLPGTSFRTQQPSPPATGSWKEPAACLQPGEDGGAVEQRGGRKASGGSLLWRLHAAGLLASECLSALKALSAPAGGSQFVCFPAQVPSVCGVACVADEHDGDGQGKGLPGWKR